MKLAMRGYVILTLDANTFLCQFGCEIQTHGEDGRIKMLYHLFTRHTAEDLALWGINRGFLAIEFSKMPNNKIQRLDRSSIKMGDSPQSLLDFGMPDYSENITSIVQTMLDNSMSMTFNMNEQIYQIQEENNSLI